MHWNCSSSLLSFLLPWFVSMINGKKKHCNLIVTSQWMLSSLLLAWQCTTMRLHLLLFLFVTSVFSPPSQAMVETVNNLLQPRAQVAWRELPTSEQKHAATLLLDTVETGAFMLADNLLKTDTVQEITDNIRKYFFYSWSRQPSRMWQLLRCSQEATLLYLILQSFARCLCSLPLQWLLEVLGCQRLMIFISRRERKDGLV